MSRIKELLNDNDSILVFDVDGVLAILEFGERTHYEMNDELWKEANAKGINYYTKEKVSKRMQKFLKNKNMNNVHKTFKKYLYLYFCPCQDSVAACELLVAAGEI